jgi:hypothetical protein
MHQSGVEAREPLILGVAPVALIDSAVRDLDDFNEEIIAPGHWPSWSYPEVPPGLALCVRCWRLIRARQLGGERCPGTQQPPAR